MISRDGKQRQFDLVKMIPEEEEPGNYPYIYVDTDPPKQITFFILLGGPERLRIQLDREIVTLTEDEQLAIVRKEVLDHFMTCHGEIELCGPIRSYIYRPVASRAIRVDVTGTVIEKFSGEKSPERMFFLDI